jgi:hypothetical protein
MALCCAKEPLKQVELQKYDVLPALRQIGHLRLEAVCLPQLGAAQVCMMCLCSE